MDQRFFQRGAQCLVWAALLALPPCGALAQVPGTGPSPAGMNAGIVKLFGTNNFTANASITVKDSSGAQVLSAPMEFALLDGKIRVQIDLGQMKSKDLPAGAAASLLQVGMSRVISVIRPDRKAHYVIYPDRKAVVNMPFSKEDSEAVTRIPRIQKTSLGKETIDGHPCVKYKNVITADKNQPIEAITWEATDMKGFPLQIQTTERGNTSVILYRQLNFTRPDPKQFEVPAGFNSYTNQQQLMLSVARDLQKKPAAAAPKK